MSEVNDDDLNRRNTDTWAEYLEEMRDSIEVYRWAMRELVAPEAQPNIKRMIWWLAIVTVLSAIQPWTVTYYFDGLAAHDLPPVIFGIAAGAACLAAKSLANRYWSAERETVLGENMGRIDIRSTELFFGKALGQHLHNGDTLSASNVARGRSSVLDVQNLLLFEGLNVLAGIMLSYLCLWFISPVAGLSVTVLFVFHVGWLFYLNAAINRECVPLEKGFRRMNRYREDRWQYIERLKACGMEEREVGIITRMFRTLIVKDRAFWIWFIDKALWRGLGNYAVLVLVQCYGAYLVWTGTWQIGNVFPLLIWSGFIVENLWRVGQIEQRLNWNASSVRSMMKALTLPPAFKDGIEEFPPITEAGVRIQFEGVRCAYPDQDGELSVLSDVTLDLPAHSKVALIGPSGAGKTTLMRLLLRDRDPSEGRVLINGIDLRGIRLGSWLRQIGYIGQQSQVFDGTVRDNLLYGSEEHGWEDPDVWALMRRLRVDFGSRLKQGLETRVGKSGLRLSGGQAQRLMIGSAVARNPRFMLVDEATSSLDSTTEREVQAGLAESLAGNVGALIVTHRLSTVRDVCNRFVVLRPSADVKPGESQVEAVASSFEELYDRSPTFRRLADDQGIVIRTGVTHV